MITEKEKKQINKIVNDLCNKSGDLRKKTKLTEDLENDIINLQNEVTDELAKSTANGSDLLLKVEKRADELKRILKNYE